MNRARNLARIATLSSALVFSLASSGRDEPGREETGREVDATWVVENLYDGQTAVRTNIVIVLTLGDRDFLTETSTALGEIRLYRALDEEPVPFTIEPGPTRSTLTVPEGLEPRTDYVLDLSWVSPHLQVGRHIPDPIHFSTRSAPQVLNFWQNEDTFIIEFSEPMNPESLCLGQQSVDFLWQDGTEIKSIAADTNVAGYVWDTAGPLFLVAPVNFDHSFWVKISFRVQSTRGAPLDGNGDGIPGQERDDLLQQVYPLVISACFTRNDIPHPCLTEEEIPETWQLW